MNHFPDHAEGGCLCGRIRFRAEGAPISTLLCHCESCRKHTGAPVVALVGYRRDQIHFEGRAPRRYASSPGVGRAYCPDCGTPLTWEGDGGEHGPLIEVLAATLDNAEAFPPTCHIHHAERMPWFETADNLPRYRVWHDDDDAPYLSGPEAAAEQIATVTRYFTAVDGEDLKGVLATLHEDCVFRVETHGVELHGHAEITGMMQRLWRNHSAVRHQDFAFVPDPNAGRIAAQFRVINTELDGRKTHKSNCNFFDIRDGKFERVSVYMAGPNTLENSDPQTSPETES